MEAIVKNVVNLRLKCESVHDEGLQTAGANDQSNNSDPEIVRHFHGVLCVRAKLIH